MTARSIIIRNEHFQGLALPQYLGFLQNDPRRFFLHSTRFGKFKFYNFQWNVSESGLGYRDTDENVNDFFGKLTDEEKNELRHNPYQFWALDYSLEGSPWTYFNWFKLITDSARKWDIPRHKLFFISSNLIEEEAYEIWCAENQIQDKINIVVVCIWTAFFLQQGYDRYISAEETSTFLKTNPYKYFLNLNRRTKIFRTYTVFRLFRSLIWNHGFISHDVMNSYQIKVLMEYLQTNGESLNKEIILDFVSSLPLILDRHDFEVNWAWSLPDHFFKSTIFNAVSETLDDTGRNTSLFFSEKAFKPILYNQPIIIFGQPGINQAFTKVNMMPYKNYFDLSFDNNPNSKSRVDQIVTEMERVCALLDGMSTESRIEWMLQDRETLEHNKNELVTQSFNEAQIKKLYEKLTTLTQ